MNTYNTTSIHTDVSKDDNSKGIVAIENFKKYEISEYFDSFGALPDQKALLKMSPKEQFSKLVKFGKGMPDKDLLKVIFQEIPQKLYEQVSFGMKNVNEYFETKNYSMEFNNFPLYMHIKSQGNHDIVLVNHNDAAYNAIYSMFALLYPDYEKMLGKKPLSPLSLDKFKYVKLDPQQILSNYILKVKDEYGIKQTAQFYENNWPNSLLINNVLKPEINLFKEQLNDAIRANSVKCSLITGSKEQDLKHACLENFFDSKSSNSIMEYKICLGISAHIISGKVKCNQVVEVEPLFFGDDDIVQETDAETINQGGDYEL